jgi:CRISPR type I-F-associated protein Csy2
MDQIKHWHYEFLSVELVKLASFKHLHISKRNPLGKDEEPPSFIAEARCDLEVSIAIECEDLDVIEGDIFCQKLASILHQVKIVSGDVISFKKNNIRIFNIEEYEKPLNHTLLLQ